MMNVDKMKETNFMFLALFAYSELYYNFGHEIQWRRPVVVCMSYSNRHALVMFAQLAYVLRSSMYASA